MKHLLLVFIFLLPVEAIAQFDFGAVGDIEQKKAENTEIKRLADVALKAKKAEERRIKEAVALERKRKLAAEKKAAANLIYKDNKTDKLREQAYEDQLRELNIQTLSAKAKRTDDYIDAELANQTASTDVVQSVADRTRMGGEAEINRSEMPDFTTLNSWSKYLIIAGFIVVVGLIGSRWRKKKT